MFLSIIAPKTITGFFQGKLNSEYSGSEPDYFTQGSRRDKINLLKGI